MAAYTALVSLMNVLYNIQIHPRVSTFVDQKQVECLSAKVESLLEFEEKLSSRGGNKEAEDLESQITSAAYAAEDVIESQLVDLIEAGSTETSPGFPIDLQKIIEDMDLLVEKKMEVKQEGRIEYSNLVATATSRSPPTMVGFDGYLEHLMDRLTREEPNGQIIPIIGMGGIGKTTLAKNAFKNSLIKEKFDLRAWVTVSQEFSVRDILLQTLSFVGGSAGQESQDDEIGTTLYQTLFHRRYLIILDDMWSIEAWEKVQLYFPETSGSRIVITTRQLDVSNYFGSSALALDFLDDDASWDLFCEVTFQRKVCPFELEEIGKAIVYKSRGLPLAVVVIGGLLRKSSQTYEYWEMVERDLSSILSLEEDNLWFDILYLSYSHLPPRLKPCFMYSGGAFPEDQAINVSQLIKLWVAEGFLLPNKLNTEQSLEEIAEGYMKELLDRNLISVRKLSRGGKVKTVGIHDLVRELCLKVGEKENFFCVVRESEAPGELDGERRIIIHGGSGERKRHIEVSMKSARSVIGPRQGALVVIPRLIRVDLNVFYLHLKKRNFNRRFLSGNQVSQLRHKLSWISLLWSLQTIILPSMDVSAPSEVWEMPQLRHFQFASIILPDPPSMNKPDCIVLQNLQTLGLVYNLWCSVEVYSRMSNIKKLQLHYVSNPDKEIQETSFYCHYNFGCLSKLESLRFLPASMSSRDDLLQHLTFPSSLKKLTLEFCYMLHWDDLSPMMGSLPHLEVLKLKHSLHGSEWNPVEGDFCSLKCLSLSFERNLVTWNAEEHHFPVLEMLCLTNVDKLEEIPIDIGNIATLKNISLMGCGVSVAISALRILEEQESVGNEGIQVQVQVQVGNENPTFMEDFQEQVELQDLVFPRPNFHM